MPKEDLTSQSELADVFQNQEIHDRWENAYRASRIINALNDKMIDRFFNKLPKRTSLSVLDAGCGVGDHTIRFAGRGCQCMGIDLSQEILQRAEQNAMAAGVSNATTFLQLGLEDLSQLNESFDVIHCRGVLMHIPNWRLALEQLCSKLKSGGHILIIENNHRSLELKMVQAIRCFRKSSREIRWTEDGAEFIDTKEGFAPLTRIANVNTLCEELRRHDIDVSSRFGSQLFDVNRFPKGILRNAAACFNFICFGLHVPSTLCVENAIVGVKN